MLQSHGLRACSGGSEYIPPDPGEYDPEIGGYFAGHMYHQTSGFPIWGSSVSTGSYRVYQLWIEPKSQEFVYGKNISTRNYGKLNTNSQYHGWANSTYGDASTYGDTQYPTTDVSDWYLPAYQELTQMFRFLRPSDFRLVANEDFANKKYGWFDNVRAVPTWHPNDGAADGSFPSDPMLTLSEDFQPGGSQAFAGNYYMSSTIANQTSNPVNSEQYGRVVVRMTDGGVAAPYYLYNSSSGYYSLNGASTDAFIGRRVKRVSVTVSPQEVYEYYEDYAQIFATNRYIGRFVRNSLGDF